MLCKVQNVKKLCLRIAFPSILFLNVTAIMSVPMARAQASSSEQAGGIICGTVLFKGGNRPASQVAVKLRSHAAGIFRSVLTDLEGHFEVRNLPASTYEIVVEEPGYEPTQTSARLDGTSSNLVLYLNSSSPEQSGRNKYTVSARDLVIPGKARSEFEKGLKTLAKRDLRASLNHFRKAVQTFPEYYEAYYHVGVVETDMGHLDEAMKAFQTAIDLSGGRYAWAEFGFGYLLYRQGKPDEAVTVISRSLEKDGSSPFAYFILGVAQLRLNRLEEAERSAREALLRNPNFAEAFLLLSDVSGRKREYLTQLHGLDSYLRLEPNGTESERVRRARELVLGLMAKRQPAE
jgi:tetratricopeptide (TPR) repeat protein